MDIQRASIAVVFVFAFSLLGGELFAHHSAAGYDRDPGHVKKLDGTVVEWRWTNPHVVLVWDVKDASGKVVRWKGELASPTSMVSRGRMNRQSLKFGDQVEVYVFPEFRGQPLSIPVRIIKDGKILLNENVRGGGTVFEDEK